MRRCYIFSVLWFLVGCGGSDDGQEGLSFDKTGTWEGAASSCDYLVGMKVCDPAYWAAEYQCGFEACLEMGADEVTANECGWAYYRMGRGACDAVKREQDLCASGLVDPETCSDGSGSGSDPGAGSGGSSNGGGGCTWCNCTSPVGEYSGTVCGSSAAALAMACYNSC